MFHSLVVGGAEGVGSVDGVSEGAEVASGTRVLVGMGARVAVGSAGSGGVEEEQAQAIRATTDMHMKRRSFG